MLNFACMLWSDGPSSDVAEGPRQNNDLWPDDQFLNIILLNKKGKVIPLQVRCGPEGG
jgi:hypothetical protein